MSSRETLWFCHECGAETIPLMAPDPICASCNSSFVEKLDDPDDDPRAMGPVDDDLDMNDAYMALLSRLLSDIPVQRRERNRERETDTTLPRPAYSFSFTSNNTTGSGTRSFTIGNRPGQAGEGQGNVPTLGEYLRRGPERDPQQPGGAAGIQAVDYFMSMLGLGPGGGAGDFNEMFARGFGGPSTNGNGRMGDYALNQQALDDIITQIMESTNSHRPVAASKEIIDKLPREVLEEKSPLLEKDCAVCKDQFSLTTEDPDEQIIVTLPCHHAFHQPCILPWLETSGTCPVCRHQLIPQPEEHHGPAPAEDRMSNERASATGQPTPTATGGLLRALFGGGMVSPGSAAGNNRFSPPAGSPPNRQSSTGYFSSDSSPSNNRRPSRDDRRPSTDNNRGSNSGSSRDNNQTHHVPGGWDDLD